MKENNKQKFITSLSFFVMIITSVLGILAGAPSAQAGLVTADLNSSLTSSDLVKTLLGRDVTVSNIKYSGANGAAGIFSGGTGIIGFEKGIILSTGNIANIVGPNNLDATSTDNGMPGDHDLQALIPGYTTFDAAVLEFDFVPTGNVMTFNYVFGSEEYNEYVNSPYNNVFGFFLDGKNIALIPGTNIPVSINNVNNGNPCPANISYPTFATNPAFFINNELRDANCSFIPGGQLDTQLDGLTVVLSATADVNPGKMYHIKLAIADAGDSVLDSGIFIQAASFTSFQKPKISSLPSFPALNTMGIMGLVGLLGIIAINTIKKRRI